MNNVEQITVTKDAIASVYICDKPIIAKDDDIIL
jgi:hypothetical protein